MKKQAIIVMSFLTIVFLFGMNHPVEAKEREVKERAAKERREDKAGPVYDYNFSVPVNVSNLPPEITRIYASCHVTIKTPGTATRRICNKACWVEPVHGAYSGTIKCGCNAPAGEDPSIANRYYCNLVLKGTLEGEEVTYFGGTMGARTDFPVDPGAPFVIHVEGTIP